MIELKDVSYQVGKQRILNQLNIQIKDKEKIALIGPSGAGKSSLLNLLSKRIEPSAGEIKLKGRLIQDIRGKEMSHTLGMITQSFDLIEALSVKSNIYVGQFRNWSLIKSLYYMVSKSLTIDSILKAVGLDKMGGKISSQLSGGEKQRVAIARLIFQDPAIVLADEPIASLDPTLSGSIIKLLLETSQDKTLVVSLHQQDFALNHFDRIIGMKEGEVFFDRPSNEVDQALLDRLYERSS